MKTVRIMIVTGEASGDLHGAHLVRALRQQLPAVEISGVGARHLQQEGITLLSSSDELAVVGIVEVVKKIGTVLRVYKKLLRSLKEHPPDLLILVDYPEFNLRLARVARVREIPIVYYISPQVWAWRSGRVKLIQRLVKKMIVIFPFEREFYQRRGVDVEWVGHPLIESVKATLSKDEFCRQHGLAAQQPILGLLPGSRESEIERLLPVMLAAAQSLHEQEPALQFVLPLASSLDNSPVIQEHIPAFVRLIRRQTYDAIHAADLIVTASGTVTVEAAILGTPMIICYRVAPLTFRLGKKFLKVPFIGMVNLIAGKEVAKELIQTAASPKRIAEEVIALLSHPDDLAAIKAELRIVRQKLGEPGAAERAARVIADVIREQGE
ncbi:lipid-A-disaccharide synthase [candidate division KSB3 bacterium]|uniref:Lipid-A-disaccharide synthase n=1 Tax=candidate division KSB3 bacterium TaxID=2044937 RepID=A0A2G6E6M0_9BACT|nr:MAG: lipid-A-disaccharide synthase [candidate division KSB3 bacterium]PIE30116.1 MAG: lipid-A-disaccharide synthase [candidate division KSB3 bacterium]